MKISVVIPAYNEEKYIGRTLEPGNNLELDGHELDILVIDPGSTDKTFEIAKKYGARVIKIEYNTIGNARQQGILRAAGEIVACTDADTILPKDWIIRHIAILKKPGVVCSCGGFRLIDGQFPIYHLANYVQPIFVWLIYFIFNIVIATGQNIVFWKEKALKIGGFDEKIGVMEDVDFVFRMKNAGKVLYNHNIIIRASGRRSKEGLNYFFRSCTVLFRYFILRRSNLGGFPDIR